MVSSWAKGSKARVWNSWLMPTPVSAQVKVKVTGPRTAGSAGGSSRQEMATEPPGWLYFTALLEMFSRI